METDYGTFGDQMKKMLELTEENNRMLKAMRRDKWIGFFVNIIFWVVILYASYYLTMQLMGPLLEQFTGSSSIDAKKLLEEYQRSTGQ